MALYALVKDGAIVRGPEVLPRQWRDTKSGTLHVFRTRDGGIAWTKAALKKLGWLPVDEVNAAFDPVAQVRTGPTLEVLASSVRATYTVRDKTAGEIDQEQDDEAIRELDGRKATRLVTRVLLDQENRLRQIEGTPAITPAEYRTSLIAAFKAL